MWGSWLNRYIQQFGGGNMSWMNGVNPEQWLNSLGLGMQTAGLEDRDSTRGSEQAGRRSSSRRQRTTNSTSGSNPFGQMPNSNDMPPWMQNMMWPNSGSSKGGLPGFDRMQNMSSQWPFNTLGFDPFWMFHQNAGSPKDQNNRR